MLSIYVSVHAPLVWTECTWEGRRKKKKLMFQLIFLLKIL